MKRVLAFLAVSLVWMGLAWGLLFAWAPAHAQEEWTRLDGPVLPGGPVLAVAASSAQSNTLYALVDHRFGVRLFRSAADTIAWTQVVTFSTENSSNSIHSLRVDPGDAELLYAQRDGAVIRSLDGGVTWTEALTATGYMAVPAPSTAYVLHRLPTDSQPEDDCFYTWRLAYSNDTGDSWNENDVPCVGEGNLGLAVAPSNPQRVYITTPDGALFRSADRGQNWEAPQTLPRFTQVSVAPNDDTLLLAVGSDGVLQSRDGGETWVSRPLWPFQDFFGPNELHFAQDGTVYLNARIYYGAVKLENLTSLLYRSDDGGDTWWLATQRPPGLYLQMLVSPGDSSTLFGWTGQTGVVISTNQGYDWQEANDGIRSPIVIETIEVDGNGGLYVGGSRLHRARNGLFHSGDGGVTWRTVLTDTQVQRAVHGQNTDYVLAIGSRILYQGDNVLSEPRELADIEILDADVSDLVPYRHVVAGFRETNEPGQRTEGVIGVWSTVNAGMTPFWRTATIEGTSMVTAVKIDAAQPERIYAAAILIDGKTTAFLRSDDAGDTWQQVSSPTDGNGESHRIDRIDVAPDGRIYADALHVLYSDDGGVTWGTMPYRRMGNTFIYDLAVAGDGQVFIATESGAFRWNTARHNWESLGLPQLETYAIAVDKTSPTETIYASNDQGLWQRSVPPAATGSVWLPIVGQ